MKSSDFNALKFLDLTYPHPSGPAAYCLHLKAREGRTYGDRDGFQGWSSGKCLSVALSGDFATVQGRFLATQDETLAVKDRRTRQVRAEIARTVQDAPTSCPSGASIGAG